MRRDRSALCGVALALLAIGTPAASLAQSPFLAQSIALRGQGRLSLEGFINQYRLQPEQGYHARPSGYGGRVLWTLAPRTDPEDESVATRTAVGPFAVVASAYPGDSRLWHAGAHADLRLVSRPAFGRVDPLLSLSAGAFHIENGGERASAEGAWSHFGNGAGAARAHRLADPDRRGTTRLALTPGLGARLFLSPGFAIRTDLRDVMVISDRLTHHVELAGGMSLVM